MPTGTGKYDPRPAPAGDGTPVGGPFNNWAPIQYPQYGLFHGYPPGPLVDSIQNPSFTPDLGLPTQNPIQTGKQDFLGPFFAIRNPQTVEVNLAAFPNGVVISTNPELTGIMPVTFTAAPAIARYSLSPLQKVMLDKALIEAGGTPVHAVWVDFTVTALKADPSLPAGVTGVWLDGTGTAVLVQGSQ